MKVFMCKRVGGYSGGLAVVAANSKEEAFAVFHRHRDYAYMLDGFNRSEEEDEYTDDPAKCDSWYYPKDNWVEAEALIANVDTPMVIAEGGYTE